MRPLGFIGIHRQHGEDIPFSIEAASGGVVQRRRTLVGGIARGVAATAIVING